MTIDPFVSFAVWFVGATVTASVGFVLTKDENERCFLAGVAMVWPAALIIAVAFSPVWIAIGVAWMFKRKPKA